MSEGNIDIKTTQDNLEISHEICRQLFCQEGSSFNLQTMARSLEKIPLLKVQR